MRYRWSNRHTDPNLLVSVVRGFFSGKGFDETRKMEKSKHGIVLLFVTKFEGSVHNVKIVIRSFEHGFEIDFESGEDLGSLGKMSSFTTILGGGILVRERLRKADPRFMERLENEFWDYIETRIEE